MKSLILGFATALITLSAQAGDILFIDINNVIPEISVVENYLKQAQAQGLERNTRLVVVPSYQTFTWQQRKDLERLSLQIEKIFKGGGNYEEVARLGKEIRKIKTGRSDQDFTLSQLEAELKSVVQDSTYQFDRVFLSGHHSPSIEQNIGILGGEFLNGFSSEMAKHILNDAPATRNVHSLALLGCYTGTPKMMGQENSPWASVLPQTSFKFGYNNPAPLKTDPANLEILRKLISAQNLVATDLNSQAQMSVEGQKSLYQNLFSVPTQGRYLGFRIGQRYFQHPAKAEPRD